MAKRQISIRLMLRLLCILLLAGYFLLVPGSYARAETTKIKIKDPLETLYEALNSKPGSGKNVEYFGVPKLSTDPEGYVKELPSGALIDRNLANGTGYSGYQIDDMAELAKKEGVIIGARSTNVDSLRHIRDRKAVPKPLDIKAKTISQADTYLGARTQDKGLVGYFEPKKPVKSEVPEKLWNEVLDRYDERLKEYNDLRDKVTDLKKSGKVIEKEGKLFAAVKNANGSVDVKPFAGDIDAVYFKDAKTGKYLKGDAYKKVKRAWMGLDKPQPDSFLDRFNKSWSGENAQSDYWSRSGAPGQHGAEGNLVSDFTEGLEPGTTKYNQAEKAGTKLRQKLADNHWKKGEVVLEMHPDGHLRRGPRFTKDTPLPNLYERPKRFASFSDEAADLGKLARSKQFAKVRRGLNSVMKGLEKLGNAASAIEVVTAIAQLKELHGLMEKALDPETPEAEAQALGEKIETMRQNIGQSLGVFIVTELNPPAAVLFGGWSLACLGNSLATRHVEKVLTGDPEDDTPKKESCAGRQKKALDRFVDWLEGADVAEARYREHRCTKFKWAVRRKILRPKNWSSVLDVCKHIESDLPIADMIEMVPEEELTPDGHETESRPIAKSKPLTRDDIAKLPAPKKVQPTLNTGELDGSLSKLDEVIADAEKLSPVCQDLAQAVGPNGRLEAMSLDIDNAFASMQLPVDDAFRTDLRSNEALLSDLRAAQDALVKAKTLIANRTDQVCLVAKNGNGTKKQGDAVTDHIKKIQNLGKLMDAVGGSQAGAIRRFREGLDNRKPFTPGTNLARDAFGRIESYCSALSSKTKSIPPRNIGAAADAFWRVNAAINQSKASGKNKAERVLAEVRLAKYMSRWNKVAAQREQCSANIGKLRDGCWDLGYKAYNEKAEEFIGVFEEMSSRRQAWADELSANLMVMNQLRVAAADYLSKAKGCARAVNKPAKTAGKQVTSPPKNCDRSTSNEPRHIYVLCGKPSTIYSSCWSEHCKTSAEIKSVIAAREDRSFVKIKKKMPCPQSAAEKSCSPPEPKRKCDQKLAKKSDGGLDKGFIGQETFKEHKGDDCEPETTVYQYDPRKAPTANDEQSIAKHGEKTPTQEKNKPTKCAALNDRVDGASDQFKEGRIKDAHQSLLAIISDISSLSDGTACIKVKARAEGNASKIGKVIDLIGDVKDALTKCEPTIIERQAKVLKGAKNVRLAALRNRVVRSKPIAVKYIAAKSAYKKGDMKSSERLFREALARVRKAKERTCQNIENRINDNLDRVDRLKNIAAIGKRVGSSCDLKSLSSLKSRLSKTRNPFLDKVYDDLEKSEKACERKVGNNACIEKFGPYASLNVSQGQYLAGQYKCSCAKGYVMRNDFGSEASCVSVKKARKADQAFRNKQCEKGRYAGPVRKDGTFYCIPTKSFANNWCRNNYPGRGAWAGKIGAKGNFRCYWRTKPAVRRQPQPRNVPTYRPPPNPCPGGDCVPTMDIPLPF